jgi:hypothetical protein
LNKNLIPIGFIYVQLPNQKVPNEIWPSMTWANISTQYANIFFRVLGDKTGPFEQIQEEIYQRYLNWSHDWLVEECIVFHVQIVVGVLGFKKVAM